MAINPLNTSHRSRLRRAVAFHFARGSQIRTSRDALYSMYKDKPPKDQWLLPTKEGTFVNLFQAFVLGQSVALAWRGPRWSVNARTIEGYGFDKRIETFLGRYSELLELPRIFRQAAVDSAFGWSAVKIVNSLPPKGVTSPYAPRAYRISPDALLVDGTAPSFDEVAYIGDTYLAPLEEARAFFPQQSHRLLPWPGASTTSMGIQQFQNTEAYATEYTRLVDLYLPTTGVICTWPAMSDRFTEIDETPLGISGSAINPYEILSLLNSPDVVEEMARLESLKALHLLANDMLYKASRQARQSKRNPVAAMGSDHDLATMLNKPDGEGAMVEDLTKIGMWGLPGPDASIVQTAQMAMMLFSQYGGNLEVSLGQSAGAQTARQTQSLIQQINARQSVDREAFERFAGNVGKKLVTLAFPNEALTLASRVQIPGTTLSYPLGWAPPNQLPRPAAIDDFNFEVVPYSTMLRTPQERVQQLTAVSGEITKFLQLLAAGAPINIEAVLKDYAEAYDLVPNLQQWWTGETPDPVAQAAQGGGQYVAKAGPNGSSVEHTYDSNAGDNEGFVANVEGNTPGGIEIPQVGGVG